LVSEARHGFLRVPIRFSDDAVVFLAQIKSTVDHGWWWSNPSLAAPTAFNALPARRASG